MLDSSISTTSASRPDVTRQTTAPYGINPAQTDKTRNPVTAMVIAEMRARSQKIAVLALYDATFAGVTDSAGVDSVMVGDSLGMACQGMTSTVAVSLEEMTYHTKCVSQGLARSQGAAMAIADLQFRSYQQSREQAIASAVQFMQAGAHMVKLEGGRRPKSLHSLWTQAFLFVHIWGSRPKRCRHLEVIGSKGTKKIAPSFQHCGRLCRTTP
jgi:3-methyl-2-oxobutanoate hydroxymethyltransferase